MNELVYLAVPYSHRDKRVEEMRFNAANRMASKLMRAGVFVFSPISHSRPIAIAGGLPHDFAYWGRWNQACISACRAMIVLRLDGWQDSKGVAAECRIMDELRRPIHYLDPFNSDQFRVLCDVLTRESLL